MKLWPLLLTALVLAGCKPAPTVPEPGPGPGPTSSADKLTPIEGLSRYALAEPVSDGNVTVVPIMLSKNAQSSETAQQKEDYITLEEAKKNSWVEIHEMPGNAQVNTLEVKNLGPKPLLLLAGELLLGGKQDRVVAKDTIIPPGKTVEVPVFCVDHDRWHGDSEKFVPSTYSVPQSVRDEAVNGDQGAVWEKVEQYNARSADYPATKWRFGRSVQGGLNSKEVKARVDAGLPKLRKALEGRGDVVGLVYVLNGEIKNVELFGGAKLFQASRDSLLRGFLSDGAVAKADKAGTVSLPDCAKFFKDVMSGERRQTSLGAGSAGWGVTNRDSTGQETTLPSASRASSSPALTADVFIHGTYSKKK